MKKLVLYAFNGMNGFVFNVPQSIFQMRLENMPLFEVKIASLDGAEVRTDLGTIIPVDGDLSLFQWADILVIAGGHLEDVPDARLLEGLQAANAQGKMLVGLCYGAYALAYAGLLDHRPAATHWLAETDFQTRFPKVLLDNNSLYCHSDNLVTSAGAAAGLDCCLYLLRHFYGAKVANQIARTLVTAPHRNGGQAQFIQAPVPHSTQDQKINQILELLKQNLAQAHRLDDLAARLNMSRRTFTRHFQKATGMSFLAWLNRERLNCSQQLLEETSLSIEQIASETGFGTAANFRGQFKAAFKIAPAQWRATFRQSDANLSPL